MDSSASPKVGRSPPRRALKLLGGLVFLALMTLPFWIGGVMTKRLDTGAREQFSKDFSCPEDRIQVHPLADLLDPARLPGRGPAAPPDEVARDPARLAIWQEEARERAKDRKKELEDYAAFDVRGCDHQVVWYCTHGGGADGVVYPTMVVCSTGAP